MAPTPVPLPRESHGWRSLEGCSPWGCEESDTTEWLHFHFSLSCIGEGNGNQLQCSCLENLRDEGGWWPAIYGVAQSQTRLKWLSSNLAAYQTPPRVSLCPCVCLCVLYLIKHLTWDWPCHKIWSSRYCSVSYRHNVVQKMSGTCLYSLTEDFHRLNHTSPFPPTPRPWQLLLYFLLQWVWLLDTTPPPQIITDLSPKFLVCSTIKTLKSYYLAHNVMKQV